VAIITFWLIDKTFSARPKTATSKARSICDAVNTHFYHRCCRCHFCAATSIGPNENMDACSLVRYTGELRTSVGRWLARSSTCVRVSLGRWWCRTSSPAGGHPQVERSGAAALPPRGLFMHQHVARAASSIISRAATNNCARRSLARAADDLQR
jgi:hypothetical protein